VRVAGWQTVGRRDDDAVASPFWIAGVGLLLVTVVAWIFVVASSGSDDMEMVPDATAYIGSWTVMMAAMMLPSVAPFALLYARGASGSAAPGLLALGYLSVWALVGIPAYALDRALGMEHDGATAAVLIAAGLYEFTPVKQGCLRKCRAPVDFLVKHWHPGLGGAFRLGVEHGAYCLGCCIALMTVLVVAGGMGLIWVVAIAAVVAAEKLLPHGPLLGKIGAIGLIAAGIALAL
jgi:predicted metal-binding membrane protein